MNHEQREDVHDVNNNLRGTLFDAGPVVRDSPIQRGVITISGVRLRVAVFPLKVSRAGREYYPVRLQYMSDCGSVLVAEGR